MTTFLWCVYCIETENQEVRDERTEGLTEYKIESIIIYNDDLKYTKINSVNRMKRNCTKRVVNIHYV